MSKAVFFCLSLTLLLSCREQSPTLLDVQLRLVHFGGVRPTEVILEAPQGDVGQGIRPLAQAQLRYDMSPEDQLQIQIKEFQDPIKAYGFWCGSGLGPSRMPVWKGSVVEQGIWSGKWVFIFRYPPHRMPNPDQMDSLVKTFPESGGKLPPIFLSLPLHQREEHGTTIQEKMFLGVPVAFDLMEQRYRNEIGAWSMARSREEISENQTNAMLSGLAGVGFKSIHKKERYSVWSDGSVQLVLGRVSGLIFVVWGRMDPETLERFWLQGSAGL